MGDPQIQSDSVISWSSDAIAADVNAEIVLMSLVRDRCYGLGTTGSSIWRKLSNPIRVSDVVAQLGEEYDAPPETIEEDLLKTLTQLHTEGLVQIHNHG